MINERLLQAREKFSRRTGVSIGVPLVVVVLFFAFHGVSLLGLTGLDPFGLGSASGERSERATQRVIAPFYQPANKVTVVLIDDQYLRDRQTGWPLAYSEQSILLRRILSAAPAALVIDLVYPHRHAGATVSSGADDALFRAIDSNTTTPVIFTAMAREFASSELAAEPGATTQWLPSGFSFCDKPQANPQPFDALLDSESIQPELRVRMASGGGHGNWHLALVRWSGCGGRYPLILGGNLDAASPAFAAYRAVCEHPPRSWALSANAPNCVTGSDRLLTAFQQPLRVRWGAFPPWEQRFSDDERTCQATMSRTQEVPLWRRLGLALRELTVGMFKDLRKDASVARRLPCPAIAVAPLSLLAKATAAEWRELIQDRVVLVGASLSGIPDVIVSPVHGQLPGVLLHAMAVDNLLRYGAIYPADRYHKATEWLSIFLVLAFAYWLPFILWLLDHPRLKHWLTICGGLVWLLVIGVCAWEGQWQIVVSAGLLAICLDLMRPTVTASYFVIICAAAVLSSISQIYGWPPGNWLGLVLLLFGFMHTLEPFYHGSDRQRMPSHYSLLAALWQRFSQSKNLGAQ